MASRYFLEVVRTGSVTEAAHRLHVAPSAVSRQVAKLEESLGCNLFDRQARGMALTEAGQQLAGWVGASVIDTERLADAMRSASTRRSHRVRIACTEGFAIDFMPAVMSAFRREHPQTSIHLQVGVPEQVSQWLQRGDADLGLKFATAPEKGMRTLHREPSPVLAICSPGHAVAGMGTIGIAELVRHALAVPDVGTTVRQALDLCCAEHGLAYEIAFSGNLPSLLALARRGDAVTLSSLLGVAHEIASGQLVALRLAEPHFVERTIELLVPEGRPASESLDRFASALKAQLRLVSAQAPARAAVPRSRGGKNRLVPPPRPA
ncbi:MAG: LysR family transcriptional regulator [Burkholderiaceae bacterium]